MARHPIHHTKFCQRRKTQDSCRKDFLTKIMEARASEDISDIQIAAHASDFVYVFFLPPYSVASY